MKQISIVSEKNPQLLAQLTENLARHEINILNIDAETVGEHTVIVMEVDQYDLALKVIQQMPRLHAISEEAILIRLKNEPGALAKITRRFFDANIAVRSIRFIERDEHYALVAISTERSNKALNLVADELVA